MKKFLSILLAVMMVLSTVSFAAPSLAGSVDTAAEVPAVDYVPEEVYEETATLAATAGDKSSYGTLVYSVDFERDDFDVTAFSTAYAKLAENPTSAYMNPDFAFGNVTCYTNAGGDGFSEGALATEGDNTYITGNVASGYDGFFRMTKYDTAWPEGYYTFVVDVKAPAAGNWTCQCNDTAIALTTIDPFEVTTEWQTVAVQTTNVVNGADMYGFFMTPNNSAAGTVSYDNWEVYYRPATVTLTIEGNEYEVSTDSAVSAATLAGYVTAPTGYILSGLSLTEGGELIEDQYFFEDTTLYPVFEKDPYMSETYGKALLVVDFENTAAQTWWGHSEYDNSTCSYGAQAYRIAKHYDSRFEGKNVRIRFVTNEGTHVDQAVAEEDGNHYNIGTTQTQWPNLTISNWGNVTGEPGVYTYVFKRMISGASSVSSSSPAGYTVVDGYDGVQGVWDTIVVQKQLDAEGNIPDGNIMNFSLAAADKTVAKIAYDDLYLYYKPLAADVTLIYNGEEYTATDVSTAGVSADSILTAAGLEIPYGKKAVLSATQGGESVGNVINLVGDSTYYVSFVADDSISEYGKQLFSIDFEKFTEGENVVNTKSSISEFTSDVNGDWSHLQFTLWAGDNPVAVDGENKYVRGGQSNGYSQFRVANANASTAPAGYYTLVADMICYDDVTTPSISTTCQGGTVTSTNSLKQTLTAANEWQTVVAEWQGPAEDMTIYFNTPGTGGGYDIGVDNVKLYYRPASVNLTVVDGENETLYENVDSVVDIDTLLADVTAPFGFKAALSTEKDGEPISGSINLVSDAKLYVVYTADETLDMTYGKALYIIDFERESMQGWNGNAQELDNSVKANGVYVYQSASYYDESIFGGKNYRVRFVINENDDWLFDQKTVEENGNHYNTGTVKTQWPQVYQTNYGAIEYKAGYYTFMVDSKTSAAPASGYGSGAYTLEEGFSIPVGEWYTIVGTQELAADGKLPSGVWFNYSFGADQVGNVTVSWDNAKMFWKPFTATVDVLGNGAVVATKTDVATNGVLASTLVDGVKVKGYNITGVKLGTTEYALTDTVVLPGDCDVELVLEEQEYNYATPTTKEDKAIRVNEPSGIRYKAELTKADMDATTAYGWIVTRDVLLTNAGLTAEDLTLDCTVNKQVGYNYGNGVEVAKIFEQDDEYAWFTAILYFSQTEEDGLPSVDKLAGDLVARPFVVNDGETLYGDATAPASMFDIALSIYYDDAAFDALDGDAQTYIEDLLNKVDANANDIPDIEE